MTRKTMPEFTLRMSNDMAMTLQRCPTVYGGDGRWICVKTEKADYSWPVAPDAWRMK